MSRLFFQNGAHAHSGFAICFSPSTLGAALVAGALGAGTLGAGVLGAGALGAGSKARLESRINKFAPHCVCRPVSQVDTPLGVIQHTDPVP